MEYNFFSKKGKYLTIGDFNIACSKSRPDMSAEIPYSGMAFYHPGEYQADFQFNIENLESDNSGKCLFGSDDFIFPTHLYRRDSGDYDWIKKQNDRTPGLAFYISEDWTKFTLYEDGTDTKGERAFHEFGSLFSYAVLNHDACVLHGVVMEYEGRGILVTASSGTGKTTHTRMWRDYKNALILNGDRCLCRKIDGIWYAYGMPWSGSSGEYINRRVPITAIVSLRQDKTNHTRILSHFEGSIYLMQRIFAPVWQCEMQDKAFELTEELAGRFPVIELSCRPDLESVEVLEKAILKQEADDGQ